MTFVFYWFDIAGIHLYFFINIFVWCVLMFVLLHVLLLLGACLVYWWMYTFGWLSSHCLVYWWINIFFCWICQHDSRDFAGLSFFFDISTCNIAHRPIIPSSLEHVHNVHHDVWMGQCSMYWFSGAYQWPIGLSQFHPVDHQLLEYTQVATGLSRVWE